MKDVTILFWEFDDAEGFPVRNLNTGLGYPTIQGAIDSGYTLDGHEIYVTAGTYYENVLLRKQVTLRGEDKTSTVIDGGNKGTAVTIVLSGAEDSDPEAGATVTGFTIRNGDVPLPEDDRFLFGFLLDSHSDAGAGISVKAPNSCIIGNDIIDSNCGVCISSSGNVTLKDNNIAGNILNLIIEGNSLSQFINDIDTSNTVDDKMVHYLVNERDMKIDSSFSDI
ncbi:MAG: hypothetical protein PVI43_07100, partial [Candidatus Bathyarchaeota archaeon]